MKTRLQRMLPSLRIIALAFPLCFILGALIGIGWYPIVLGFVAMIAVGLIVSRPRLAVWITIIGAIVISGTVELYLPKFQSIRWAFALLGILLGAVVVLRRLWDGSLVQSRDCARFLSWGAVFFACAFCAGFLESGSFIAAVVGLKGYFQLWGVMLAIAFIGYKPQEANRIIYFFVFLALIQLPFVLHQYLYLVPMRTNDIDAAQAVVAIDIVSGTFGGQLHGGGRSLDSAILACIGISIVMALWRIGRIGAWRALPAAALILAPMALNEAKFVIFALPLALFVVYRDKLLKNPLQFIAGSTITVAVLSFMLIGYSLLPGARSQNKRSFDKYLTEMVSYNFGNKGYGRSYLNRTTVYSHWFSENVMRGRWDKALFGYGVGATNTRSAFSGDETLATTRYRFYNIGLTSVSALLWEVGLLGLATVAGLFVVLYRMASRLVLAQRGSPHWPLLIAAQASIPVFALSLLAANYFVIDLGFQAMFVTIAGYLLCMSNALKEEFRVSV